MIFFLYILRNLLLGFTLSGEIYQLIFTGIFRNYKSLPDRRKKTAHALKSTFLN